MQRNYNYTHKNYAEKFSERFPRVEKTCPVCGDIVKLPLSLANRFRFCSHECYHKSTSGDTELKLIATLWGFNTLFTNQYHIEDAHTYVDIALVDIKLAIFVDGDYLHVFRGSIQHDIEVANSLQLLNWTVLRYWEHTLNSNLDMCVKEILDTADELSTHNIAQKQET